MIRMKCEMVITDEQVIDLFRLFLYSCKSNNERVTKSGFLAYVRMQLIMFGTDAHLVGGMESYDELTSDEMQILYKWKLISRD